MRIIGGQWRGARLKAPPAGSPIRPTTDERREQLFNILEHRFCGVLSGATVIDLFAGTGALGLEALSRGGKRALFVETSARARGLIRENLETLGLSARGTVLRRSAVDLGASNPHPAATLAFLDPPYEKGLAEQALKALDGGGWLAVGALCVVEESAQATLTLPTAFSLENERRTSRTQLLFLRYKKEI